MDVGGRSAALSRDLGGRPVSSAGFRHYQTGWGEFHGEVEDRTVTPKL